MAVHRELVCEADMAQLNRLPLGLTTQYVIKANCLEPNMVF